MCPSVNSIEYLCGMHPNQIIGPIAFFSDSLGLISMSRTKIRKFLT